MQSRNKTVYAQASHEFNFFLPHYSKGQFVEVSNILSCQL